METKVQIFQSWKVVESDLVMPMEIDENECCHFLDPLYSFLAFMCIDLTGIILQG